MPRCTRRCSGSPWCCWRADVRGAGGNVPGARAWSGPIQALRAGAERIGGGDFAQRIAIKTGDELEGLANQFNDMGARLQESYADLENKVEQRTAELSESLEQQTATAEVLQGDQPLGVRSAAGARHPGASRATTLCGAEPGHAAPATTTAASTRPQSQSGAHADKFEFRKSLATAPDRGTVSGRAVQTRRPPCPGRACRSTARFTRQSPGVELAGFRAMLAVPLMRRSRNRSAP